jgi:hypothetical protein
LVVPDQINRTTPIEIEESCACSGLDAGSQSKRMSPPERQRKIELQEIARGTGTARTLLPTGLRAPGECTGAILGTVLLQVSASV